MGSGFDFIGSLRKIFHNGTNANGKSEAEIKIVNWDTKKKHASPSPLSLPKARDTKKLVPNNAFKKGYDTTVLEEMPPIYEEVAPERKIVAERVVREAVEKNRLLGALVISKKGNTVAEHYATQEKPKISPASLPALFKSARDVVRKVKKKRLKYIIITLERYVFMVIRSRELYLMVVGSRVKIGSIVYITNKLSKDIWTPLEE